jgi:hypothetical protein
MALARRARDEGLLVALLPPSFPLAEECVTCADSTYMCCGPGGRVARVAGCGCVACPEGMAAWIEHQVDEGLGTGEVGCVGCRKPLSQFELDTFCPAGAPPPPAAPAHPPALGVVRKTPSWPRSWANFSLL